MTREGESKSSIEICDYEEWMKPQLARLFAAEYGGTEETQTRALETFYDHPFQRDRAIRLVAVDGETVCGFQSLFYWPYQNGSTVYRSYQSGRSLVSVDYRGRGIFGRLLGHLDENYDAYGCDFLMGFPVEASYGSFIRAGWMNPLNLSWFVRPLNPLSVLRPKDINQTLPGFDVNAETFPARDQSDGFAFAEDESFLEWRSGFSHESHHSHFHYREGEELVRFDCKPNRRGRVTELIVGGVRRTSDSKSLLKKALSELIRAAKKSRELTMISFAMNEQSGSDPMLPLIRSAGFFRIRPKIYFITKSFAEVPSLDDADQWTLYRSDIDTW